MNDTEQTALKERYQRAVDAFIDRVREDVNVIAIIVSGSFTYDVLWEKSDVDMTVVVRDQPLKSESLSIIEDGITLNVYLMPRSRFKRGAEGAIGGSFIQSYLAHGKIVYSTDDSLSEFFEDVRIIGEDDISLSALYLANNLISTMHKAQKWLTVRKDLLYAQYFLLSTAETIAHMELCIRGIPTSRSAIQKALELNPEMMNTFYLQPLGTLLSEEVLSNKINQLDCYIEEKMAIFQKPVIEYLADQEIKTTTMIARQFRSDSHFITNVLDYLAEKGVIEKVSQLIKITPKSRMSVEEIGYLFIPPNNPGD
jgi:uncharacterized protein